MNETKSKARNKYERLEEIRKEQEYFTKRAFLIDLANLVMSGFFLVLTMIMLSSDCFAGRPNAETLTVIALIAPAVYYIAYFNVHFNTDRYLRYLMEEKKKIEAMENIDYITQNTEDNDNQK